MHSLDPLRPRLTRQRGSITREMSSRPLNGSIYPASAAGGVSSGMVGGALKLSGGESGAAVGGLVSITSGLGARASGNVIIASAGGVSQSGSVSVASGTSSVTSARIVTDISLELTVCS